MKARLVLVRITVIFMVLILSQKIGVGLALHNAFHSTSSNSSLPNQQKDNKGQELTITCNCIDDFLMPFEPGTELVFTSLESKYLQTDDLRSSTLHSSSLIHFSLRGPPASL